MGTLTYFAQATMGVETGRLFVKDSEESEQEQEEQEEEDVPPSRANEKEFDQRLLIDKTKPEPCDQEMYLYTRVHYNERNISNSGYNKTMTDNCTR